METKYPHQTAGRIMTDKVPTVSDNSTVGDVEALLLKESANFETINYVYLLSGRKLTGVISLKELFRSPKTQFVKELSPEKVISVHSHTDQERAARLAVAHSVKAIPVVDKENNFLGVVDNDTIIKILEAEGVEDILKFGGVSYKTSLDNILTLSFATSIKHRLPWLILGLFGGMFVSVIVGSFEEVLSQNIVLAAFIPLVVYMASAVGTQMEAFIIRDFALNPKFNFTKYFIKQAMVVFMIAVIVSLILYGTNMFLNRDTSVSLVLGLALFFAILSSLITGLIVPYLFGRMKLDPANASGPIATIIQDALSVFVYFYIASLLL